MKRTAYAVMTVIMFVIVIAGITTCAGANAPQSVYFTQPAQDYATAYRECQEAEGQYVKSALELRVDKILAGCVN
jgi:hypothetical protein